MTCLVIFDADGTLTPLRGGSTGAFERRLLPGVVEKCVQLRADGVTLAIISNQGGADPDRADRRSIGAVLAQLRWTAAAVGADTFRFAVKHGARYKPSPVMLQEVMREVGASPEETVYVGDERDADVGGAKAAGLAMIQVVYPGGPDPHPHADAHVDRGDLARELPSLLEGL